MKWAFYGLYKTSLLDHFDQLGIYSKLSKYHKRHDVAYIKVTTRPTTLQSVILLFMCGNKLIRLKSSGHNLSIIILKCLSWKMGFLKAEFHSHNSNVRITQKFTRWQNLGTYYYVNAICFGRYSEILNKWRGCGRGPRGALKLHGAISASRGPFFIDLWSNKRKRGS